MQKLKDFTQSITGILVFFMAVAIALIFAQIMRATGLLQVIDNLYPTHVKLFWFLLIITRMVYSFSWYFATARLIYFLDDLDFFWFDEESYTTKKQLKKDRSEDIIVGTIVVVIATVCAEILIRIFTLTIPIYIT